MLAGKEFALQVDIRSANGTSASAPRKECDFYRLVYKRTNEGNDLQFSAH